MLLTPGDTLTIWPLPDKALAPMRDAELIDTDDRGVLVRYRFGDSRHLCTSFVPWRNIGRIEIKAAAA